MNKQKIARELVRIAREIKSSDRIIDDAVGKYWNELNDLSDELLNAYNEYNDISGYDLEKDKKMMAKVSKIKDLLIDARYKVRKLSEDTLRDLVDVEREFTREYGSPEDIVEEARSRFFPK